MEQTWQDRMRQRHGELMEVTQDQQQQDQIRRDAFERALRLEKILREEGEFEFRVTI